MCRNGILYKSKYPLKFNLRFTNRDTNCRNLRLVVIARGSQRNICRNLNGEFAGSYTK